MSDAVETLTRYCKIWETDGWPSSTEFGQSLVDNIREVLVENERLRAEREEILKSFRLKVEECAEALKENERLLRLLDELRAEIKEVWKARIEAALEQLTAEADFGEVQPGAVGRLVKALRGGDDDRHP